MVHVDELRSITAFSGCTAPELREMARCFHRVSFRKFREIHREGEASENVSAVLRGEVGLHAYVGDEGRPVRLAIVKGGEMFGIGEFMLPRYYTNARAMTACTLLQIRREDFRDRAMAIASIRAHVLLTLSQISHYLIHRVTAGGAMDSLALYLQKMSQESGKASNGFIHIQHKLRQPEIASVLNLSREHVSRLFAKLRLEGAVKFNRGLPIIRKSWLDRIVRDKELAASIEYRDAPF